MYLVVVKVPELSSGAYRGSDISLESRNCNVYIPVRLEGEGRDVDRARKWEGWVRFGGVKV
jgi:hypothetical protein